MPDHAPAASTTWDPARSPRVVRTVVTRSPVVSKSTTSASRQERGAGECDPSDRDRRAPCRVKVAIVRKKDAAGDRRRAGRARGRALCPRRRQSTATPHRCNSSASLERATRTHAVGVDVEQAVGGDGLARLASIQSSQIAVLRRARSASAGAAVRTDWMVQLRTKPAIHRQKLGAVVHVTDTAPSLRTRPAAALARAPGAASGITWLGTRWPALPSAHPPSIGPRSTTTTRRPRAREFQRRREPDDPRPDHDHVAVVERRCAVRSVLAQCLTVASS